MRVVLFRHGIAGSHDPKRWPDDALRPLTSRGRVRTEEAARGLVRIASIDRILSSPLVRAMETAEILQKAADLGRVIESLPALAPGGTFADILARLKGLRANECVALVGHEPDLGKLAAALCFKTSSAALPMKKAGACLIEFVGKPELAGGQLSAFLPPRLLRSRKHKVAS